MGNFLFIWMEERRLCSLCYQKRHKIHLPYQHHSSLTYTLSICPEEFHSQKFLMHHFLFFCTFNILSFFRIFSICLVPLWPPNLLTHSSSWKGDNLFFLFEYFFLVLKSHRESQLHPYYTPFLLFSISGFHFNPSDASVSHVPKVPWNRLSYLPVPSHLITIHPLL